MFNSKKVIFSVLVLVVIGLGFYFLNSFIERIEITDKQIQTAINSKMPFSKDIPFGEVSIKEASIDLNDTIKIHSYGLLEGAGREVPFVVDATGTIKYSSGSFYFIPSSIDVKLKEVEVVETNSIKSKLFGKISDISKNVGINKGNVEEKISEVVKSNLSNIPLYKLKPGLISASLKNVKVEKNKVILEMSVLELVKTIVIGVIVVLLIVGLIFVFFRSGGVGVLDTI